MEGEDVCRRHMTTPSSRCVAAAVPPQREGLAGCEEPRRQHLDAKLADGVTAAHMLCIVARAQPCSLGKSEWPPAAPAQQSSELLLVAARPQWRSSRAIVPLDRAPRPLIEQGHRSRLAASEDDPGVQVGQPGDLLLRRPVVIVQAELQLRW